MTSKRPEKRNDLDKSINYKNLITQYYEKDPQLADISDSLKKDIPEVEILQTLSEFEKKIDTLIKK